MAWSLGLRHLDGSALTKALGIEDEPHVAADHTGLTVAEVNLRIYRALLARRGAVDIGRSAPDPGSMGIGMGLLKAIGLGKDPHVEWMVEAFRAAPAEIVANCLYEGTPQYQLWRGEKQGVPVTFYTEASARYRGGHAIYLGEAGPQFMGEVSEYRCFFYRPQRLPSLSIDESRWAAAVDKAMKDGEDWSSSFPEEAFELGVAMGRFAIELDCPLDPRPVFAQLPALRKPLDVLSDAVERVYVYAAGVGVGFNLTRLTREKLLADVNGGLEILRLSPR